MRAVAGDLLKALELAEPQTVALVGSGGKTTLMYALAAEIAGRGGQVAVTTTTRIYPPTPGQAAGPWLIGQETPDPRELARRLAQESPLCIAAGPAEQGKLQGLSLEQIAGLQAAGGWLLVEADGAARLPLKGWADHEPVLPEQVGTVIVVVGASGLGRPLASDWVHRPERFAQASGLKLGQAVTGEAVARVLSGPAGPLRNMAGRARAVALINQADAADRRSLEALERGLRESGVFERVVVTSLAGNRP